MLVKKIMKNDQYIDKRNPTKKILYLDMYFLARLFIGTKRVSAMWKITRMNTAMINYNLNISE